MKKISVAIATFNEQKNIERCLKSIVSWVDEIVIVDGSSSDKTVEIARKYGASVVISDNPPIFHINKQKAVDLCKSMWILQLDADEVVTQELKNEIIRLINDSKSANGYYLPRKNFLLGKWIKKGGLYPDFVIRLFRKGKGRFPKLSVHEQIKVDGEIGYLKNSLLHYAYPDFSEYIRKANVYTSLTVEEFKKNKLQVNFLNNIKYIFLLPLSTFWVIFFRHLGFLDGFPGFVWAFFSALHWQIAYIKYWEYKNSQNNS